MINIAILDDCEKDIVLLKQLITNYPTNFKINYAQFNELNYEQIFIDDYDLYILDIDMPKLNGIDVAKKINQFNESAKIIFYSNREDLVFETFCISSIFFIRKSKVEQDFIKAFKKISTLINKETQMFDFENYHIAYKDIIYVESRSNYVYIHLKNDLQVKLRVPLKTLIDKFISNNFILVYHGVLVNCCWINKIDETEERLQLKNNEKIPISCRKYNDVKNKYFDYLLGEL